MCTKMSIWATCQGCKNNFFQQTCDRLAYPIDPLKYCNSLSQYWHFLQLFELRFSLNDMISNLAKGENRYNLNNWKLLQGLLFSICFQKKVLKYCGSKYIVDYISYYQCLISRTFLSIIITFWTVVQLELNPSKIVVTIEIVLW